LESSISKYKLFRRKIKGGKMKKVLFVLSMFAVMLTAVAGDYYYGGSSNRKHRNSAGYYYVDYSIPTYNSQSPRQGTYDNSRSNPYSYSEKKTGSWGQTYYEGNNGGEYYINRSGNKTYYNRQPSNLTPVFQGSKGGNYYYNNNGNKVYIRKK
jgi:hypothetical protein